MGLSQEQLVAGFTAAGPYPLLSLPFLHILAQHKALRPECTAVAAIELRMRMRILTRLKNSLANFLATKSQTKKSCEFSVAKEFANECEWFCKCIREKLKGNN